MESLAQQDDVRERLTEARQRAQVREGLTTAQVAKLMHLTLVGARTTFADAIIVPGARGGRPAIFSRAAISDLLSQWNGARLGCPHRPLLTPVLASQYLTKAGVALSPTTLCWMRSAGGGPASIKLGTGAPAHVRYDERDLIEFVIHRKLTGHTGQGFGGGKKCVKE